MTIYKRVLLSLLGGAVLLLVGIGSLLAATQDGYISPPSGVQRQFGRALQIDDANGKAVVASQYFNRGNVVVYSRTDTLNWTVEQQIAVVGSGLVPQYPRLLGDDLAYQVNDTIHLQTFNGTSWVSNGSRAITGNDVTELGWSDQGLLVGYGKYDGFGAGQTGAVLFYTDTTGAIAPDYTLLQGSLPKGNNFIGGMGRYLAVSGDHFVTNVGTDTFPRNLYAFTYDPTSGWQETQVLTATGAVNAVGLEGLRLLVHSSLLGEHTIDVFIRQSDGQYTWEDSFVMPLAGTDVSLETGDRVGMIGHFGGDTAYLLQEVAPHEWDWTHELTQSAPAYDGNGLGFPADIYRDEEVWLGSYRSNNFAGAVIQYELDSAYTDPSEDCTLSTGQTVNHQGAQVTIQGILEGTPCLRITHFERDHGQATGAHGQSGVGWGEYWHIASYSGTVTATITLPHNDVANPKACRYTGGAGYGWDCDLTSATSSTVTRLTSEFSDWAVGTDVGPTAVSLHTATSTSNTSSMLFVLLVLLLLVGTGTAVQRRHMNR